jgi:hypothetical protein
VTSVDEARRQREERLRQFEERKAERERAHQRWLDNLPQLLEANRKQREERDAQRELGLEMIRVGRKGYVAQYRFGLTDAQKRRLAKVVKQLKAGA